VNTEASTRSCFVTALRYPKVVRNLPTKCKQRPVLDLVQDLLFSIPEVEGAEVCAIAQHHFLVVFRFRAGIAVDCE
jgi:hypothetical protein